MQDQLEKDLKTAMLARDQQTVGVVKLLKGALQNAAIAKRSDLSEEEVTKILVRQAKQRQEAIELYEKAGDSARAEAEQAELEIIEKYLPEPLTSDELAKMVEAAITELTTGDEAPHKGAVIQAVINKAGGRAGGSEIAQLVNRKMS